MIWDLSFLFWKEIDYLLMNIHIMKWIKEVSTLYMQFWKEPSKKKQKKKEIFFILLYRFKNNIKKHDFKKKKQNKCHLDIFKNRRNDIIIAWECFIKQRRHFFFDISNISGYMFLSRIINVFFFFWLVNSIAYAILTLMKMSSIYNHKQKCVIF